MFETEYIEDATPCTTCHTMPRDFIDQGEPLILCGIPCNASYGTRIRCFKCGKQTGVHSYPGAAFKEWNTIINKEVKNDA